MQYLNADDRKANNLFKLAKASETSLQDKLPDDGRNYITLQKKKTEKEDSKESEHQERKGLEDGNKNKRTRQGEACVLDGLVL